MGEERIGEIQFRDLGVRCSDYNEYFYFLGTLQEDSESVMEGDNHLQVKAIANCR